MEAVEQEKFMQPRNFMRAAALGWLTLMFGGFLHAQDSWNFPDFSATQVFESRKMDLTMKVYRSGSSVRIERNGMLSTLYMPASSKVYNLTVYPDHSRQCVSMKPEQAKMLPSPLELIQGKIVKRTALGSEVVEGHNCKVENVTVTRPDGKTIESKVWEAEDLKGVPVKIESHPDGITLRAVYRNIELGAPDAALFTVPERCTPFEKMGQVAEVRVLK
jgi:hypothetical protein